MKGLTEKQHKIFDFIAKFEEREGMAPTVYEIADHFGVRTATVFAHVRALQRKDVLIRTRQARSIKLTGSPHGKDSKRQSVNIRLEDSSGIIGEYHLDPRLVPDAGEYSAMRVPDNAMSDFGIFADDVVIIGIDREHRPGDLVAVEVTGKMLLRSFYSARNDQLELRPGNPDFETMILPQTEVEFRGVVTALH